MLAIVGALFAVTLTKNVAMAVEPASSLSVTVMFALPLWAAAGVTVIVRLLSLPPKTKFALGTSVGLEELAVRTRLLRAVSGSLIVNAIGPVEVFTLVV